MVLSDEELFNLKSNEVSASLLWNNGCSSYVEYLTGLRESYNFKPTCTGFEFVEAVDFACDEDNLPYNCKGLICDGILAVLLEDKLNEVGIDLTGYFANRLKPSESVKMATAIRGVL